MFEDQPVVIGIDVGRVRTGISKADGSMTLASPFSVIETEPTATLADRIHTSLGGAIVRVSVAGLPLNQYGKEGPEAKYAMSIAELIVKGLDCELVFEDERFSTQEMHVRRGEAGISRKKRLKDIDAWAAATILQGYLDKQKNAMPG